jgi:hypothetical protein
MAGPKVIAVLDSGKGALAPCPPILLEDGGGTLRFARYPIYGSLSAVIASQRVGAARRPMTGSAKQSIVRPNKHLDCFVAYAPRNDEC